MKVLAALANRRSPRLAGAMIVHDDTLGWQVILYTVVNNQLAPFGISPADSREDALTDANETLKTSEQDWIEADEAEAEEYILNNTANKWKSSPGK